MNGAMPLAVLEKRHLRADGEVVWSHSRVSLLPTRSGPATSVAVVADITELKCAHQRLGAVNLSLQAATEGSLLGLGSALKARDLETSGHTVRVVQHRVHPGQVLCLGPASLHGLEHGASLHDIGRLTIPGAELLNPGRLGPTEWLSCSATPRTVRPQSSAMANTPPGALDVIRSHLTAWTPQVALAE